MAGDRRISGRALPSFAVLLAFLLAALAQLMPASQALAAQETATPPAFTAPRPVFSPGPASAFQPAAAPQTSQPDLFKRAWVRLIEIQQDLHRRLAKPIRELRTNPFSAGLTLILLSFVYGVLHAVGPGHGKAVISSYVLANRQTARRAVAISFAAALVQGFVAVGLVLVLGLILKMAGLRMQAAIGEMERISFALVALAGGWLFASQLRRIAAKSAFPAKIARRLGTLPLRPFSLSAAAVAAQSGGHEHDHGHAHSHSHGDHSHDDHEHGPDCGCGHRHLPAASEIEGEMSFRRAAAIILAVGVRPCTGAIFVLVFALTQGLFWAGVIATFAMALGTAITVSALTVAAVGARDLTARMAGRGGGGLAENFYDALALGGTFAIFAIGMILFAASLGPARPF
jgi:ABC-type nickel/cobalt efflux system permease component RcnA